MNVNPYAITLCITGTTGFAGSRLADYYQSRFKLLTPGREELVLTDPQSCLRYMELYRPDYVVHCAALSDTGYCEAHEEESYQINVMGTVYLAKAAQSIGSRFIYFSSDQVYCGSQSACSHSEEETNYFTPANVYGRHKLEAENRIASVTNNYICLRLTWMFDLPVRHRKTSSNFLLQILKAIFTQTPIPLSTQEYRGITDIHTVIKYMEPVLTLPSGVYNYGSENAYSTYDLAAQLLKELSLCSYSPYLYPDADRYPNSPKNLLINTSKLQTQHILFPNSLQALQTCIQEYGLLSYLT